MIDLKNLTIEKAHEGLKSGAFSCKELLDAYLAVIKEKNENLNAFLEIFDDIVEQAEKAQNKFKEGTAEMLTGIPIAIKDNILFQGHIASAGSKILENHKASYDSFVIKELKKIGAVVIGRTNMDEFAMGSSTQTSAYGVSRNPYDVSRVPGGSSGGSAIAVAADMALVALGTETCGSVREPAAFCGLVGLKPTYGAVSRNGIVAMGNSLDQVSPLSKTVREAEIVFRVLSKYDLSDATSIKEEDRVPNKSSGNKTIGIPWGFFETGVEEEIMENFRNSIDKLRNAGYEIVDLELPSLKYSLAVYYIIMPSEVSTNLSRFDGIRYGLHKGGRDVSDTYKKTRSAGFGAEARRRIILGGYVLSEDLHGAYSKAIKVRNEITKEMEYAFKKVDFILTPTAPFLPFKIGEKMDDPVAMYLADIFSAPANLAGVPSIAVPSGFSKNSLPFSVQFTAPHFCEDALFEVGKKFEEIRGE
ncbi:MAG: Asp-tRNA(Asn)/Glu-tRNA(Gln) amidotransferase subunit GatA [bacterium]|nr:Asp-tRNA(Asn)/Glu-tRNA(Gln) amidotransferase subunit GatA [bacterium]